MVVLVGGLYGDRTLSLLRIQSMTVVNEHFTRLLAAADLAEGRRIALGFSNVFRAIGSAKKLTLEELGDVEAAERACREANAAIARWRAPPAK